MKNIIMFIFFGLLLFGCAEISPGFIFGERNYPNIFENTGNKEKNCKNIYIWIHENIKWESRDEVTDLEKMWKTKSGDCKDMAHLMIDMLVYYYGYEPGTISVDTSGNEIVDHLVVYYKKIVYDPTNLIISPLNKYESEYNIITMSTLSETMLNYYWTN